MSQRQSHWGTLDIFGSLHSALQKFHSYKQIGLLIKIGGYDQFPHWSIGWYPAVPAGTAAIMADGSRPLSPISLGVFWRWSFSPSPF